MGSLCRSLVYKMEQLLKARSEDMTGYRRLISYIYAYEGEEKGKNIGFVKLESRNGQCRLSVNVKKIYAGGNDIGVYPVSYTHLTLPTILRV